MFKKYIPSVILLLMFSGLSTLSYAEDNSCTASPFPCRNISGNDYQCDNLTEVDCGDAHIYPDGAGRMTITTSTGFTYTCALGKPPYEATGLWTMFDQQSAKCYFVDKAKKKPLQRIRTR